MSWLSGWLYRKKVSLTGQSGAGTNYQVKLIVGESSGVSGTNFHVENHSISFPSGENQSGDLRFTDNDELTLLDFWVERVEGITPNRKATIWVEVGDNLDTNQDIYCYYNKSGASNVSNGNNTFLLFDDFNDNNLDVNKWEIESFGTASLVEQNQRIECSLSGIAGTNYKYLKSKNNLTGNFNVQVNFSDLILPNTDETASGGLEFKIDADNLVYIRRDYTDAEGQHYRYAIKISGIYYWGNTSTTDISGKIRITRVGSTITTYYWNGSSWTQANQKTNFSTNNGVIAHWIWTNNGATASCNYDNFIESKYTTPEPSFASVSNEEVEFEYIGQFTLSLIPQSTYFIPIIYIGNIPLSLNLNSSYFYQAYSYIGNVLLSLIPNSNYGIEYSYIGNISINLNLASPHIFWKGKYCSRIIYNNPLIIVCDTSPVRIIKATLDTNGNIISLNTVILTGFNNAKDVCINDTFDKIYVACANGIISKIDLDDLEIRELINTQDSNNLTNIVCKNESPYTYVGTDDTDGEVIEIDESSLTQLKSDFRFNLLLAKKIETFINTTYGKLVQSDLRTQVQVKTRMKSDLRFFTNAYYQNPNPTQPPSPNPPSYPTPPVPIKREDFHVYIGAELTDVDLESIKVRIPIDDYAKAEFTIAREHDTYTPVQANVNITLAGHTIFTGKIDEVDNSGSSETVTIHAISEEIIIGSPKTITLPLARKEEQTTLHDVVLDDINTTNIYIPPEPTEEEPSAEDLEHYEYKEVPVIKAQVYTNGSYTETETSRQVVINPTTGEIIGSPEDLKVNEPTVYRGIRVNLGKEIREHVIRWSAFRNAEDIALDVKEGEFHPKQNWTYFWWFAGIDYLKDKEIGSLNYIGTSPSGLSSGLIDINRFSYKYQKILTNTENELGYYEIGQYPYREISCRNGRYIPEDKWIDKEDGFYKERNEGYDYVKYAMEVAKIEYAQLEVELPEEGEEPGKVQAVETKAVIDLTLDGYFYYNMIPLTKINLSDTIQSSIFANQNGFPLTVKEIDIDSNDMLAHFSCDNVKTEAELEKELEEGMIEKYKLESNKYPDENDKKYITEGYLKRITKKFDPVTFSEVSIDEN